MPAFAFRHIKDLYPVFWSKSREMVACVTEASKSTVPPSEKLPSLTGDAEKAAADVPQHAPGIIDVGNCKSWLIWLVTRYADFHHSHLSCNS